MFELDDNELEAIAGGGPVSAFAGFIRGVAGVTIVERRFKSVFNSINTPTLSLNFNEEEHYVQQS